MNKAEYRIRTDEIKELINEREYEEAAAVADEIDWRRVKSVKMLCTVSDLYKINRRFDDAKNILLIAYRKNPQSRTILYALCDLSIRLEELLDAIAYYKAYVQVAPRDPGRYVLQYRLYQAQGVGIGERIEVLEALKAEEYTERWGYELALLYHRNNQADQCVAECNQLILWFGEGKYVTKAMELKMLHEPLTQSQQYLYDHRGVKRIPSQASLEETVSQESAAPDQWETKPYGAGAQNAPEESTAQEIYQRTPADVGEQAPSHEEGAAGDAEEIRVKTVDVENKYSTMNLQRELAESLRALLGEVKKPFAAQEAAQQGTLVEEDILFEQEDQEEDDERFATKEILSLSDIPRDKVVEIYREPVVLQDEEEASDIPEQTQQSAQPQPTEPVEPVHIMEVQHPDNDQDSMIDMTRMESDGQIRMILPEPVRLEKQITGQLSLDDILAEWERRNQQIEKEHRDEIYERIKKQTGDIFDAFDARQREDILNELNDLADKEEEKLRGQETGSFYEETETPEQDDALYAEDEPPQEENEFLYEEETCPQEEPALLYEEEAFPVKEPEFGYAGNEFLPQDSELSYAEEPEAEEAAASYVEDERASLTFREKVPERYRRYIHSDDGMWEIRNAIREAGLPIENGNIVVTGDNYDYCFDFIKQLLSDLRDSGMRLSGKLARISAVNLNRKKAVQIMDALEGGAMVIERVSMLSADKMKDIQSALQAGERNMLLILVDTPDAVSTLSARRPDFMEYFPIRINMQGMSTKELVRYGSAYAYSEEYVIDEMALLALQTRLEDEEASDRVPMPEDVEEMVNAAIRHVNRIGIRRFAATLSGSRYNEEDMVILKEQDFT
ncbi:MAG: hypothetical protein LUC95_09830 [Lachnospiraceae bacterium]|nr:hypothetical protein [Lachnospiraceae bacterium]